jgi:hypothetical protein
VANTRSSGISVEDCATTEILVWWFDAVSGPGTVPGPETASNHQTSDLSHDNRADQNAVKSCVLSSNF